MTMKIQLIIFLTFTLLAGCSQGPKPQAISGTETENNAELPVSLHNGYTLPDLLEQSVQSINTQQINTLLSKTWYADFNVIDAAHSDNSITLSNCKEYLAHPSRQLNTRRERDNAAFMEIAVMCQATAKIIKATPATASYLSDLAFDQALPTKFPAELAMFTSQTERTRILSVDAIQTWAQASEITGVEAHGTYLTTYHSVGGSQEIALVARGDFNQDGIEDMMITSRDSVTGGSYSAIRLFSLTRTSANGKFTLIP